MSEYLPFVLIALACPIGMGAMMWFMMKGMRGGHPGHTPHEEPAANPRSGPGEVDLRSAPVPSDRP